MHLFDVTDLQINKRTMCCYNLSFYTNLFVILYDIYKLDNSQNNNCLNLASPAHKTSTCSSGQAHLHSAISVIYLLKIIINRNLTEYNNKKQIPPILLTSDSRSFHMLKSKTARIFKSTYMR